MSEPLEESGSGSLMEKITEKIHHYNVTSSSSSDSDNDKPSPPRKNRLFGRQKPVHTVLGGGKSADIILWRNKRITVVILVGVTVIWFLFECLGYHVLTFLCHASMVGLGIFFCWSTISCATNMSPPKFPEVILPEDLFVSIALAFRYEINRVFAMFREIATGKDLKKLLAVIAALWVISVVGSWFTFLTLFYIVFVMLHTVPVLYEKHEDHVDTFAQKAGIEVRKRYAVLDAKLLQKLPKTPFKVKKEQ